MKFNLTMRRRKKLLDKNNVKKTHLKIQIQRKYSTSKNHI